MSFQSASVLSLFDAYRACSNKLELAFYTGKLLCNDVITQIKTTSKCHKVVSYTSVQLSWGAGCCVQHFQRQIHPKTGNAYEQMAPKVK